MILKNLLNSQKLISKIKKYTTKEIFDIVIYGSVIKGKSKFNDIDIAVILKQKLPLNKKLEIAQKLRRELEFIGKEIDVKVVGLEDFMDKGFLARQAILSEGYSLIHKKFLHEMFGFKVHTLFSYKLEKLNASQKKMFYYALKGRRDAKGLLEKTGSSQLSNCILLVPLEFSEEFKELFELHKIEYSADVIMKYEFS